MRFQSIRIKEGLSERTINFSDGANLIHSGKTVVENHTAKTDAVFARI